MARWQRICPCCLIREDATRKTSARAHRAGQCPLVAVAEFGSNVLAIFEGPWSYVTASWYPGATCPRPTTTRPFIATAGWNGSRSRNSTLLLRLSRARMETPIPGGWSTSEIPRREITRRFAAIEGFAFHIERMEAKFKLGQDEPLRDALAVAEKLEDQRPRTGAN